MKKSYSLIAAALLASGCANVPALGGASVNPFVAVQHQSPLFSGSTSRVGYQRATKKTNSYIAAGVTLEWSAVELDVMYGIRARDCNSLSGESCYWMPGAQIGARWYPGRERYGE
jgi:hypothetical protein